jgi:hypothetical protein
MDSGDREELLALIKEVKSLLLSLIATATLCLLVLAKLSAKYCLGRRKNRLKLRVIRGGASEEPD